MSDFSLNTVIRDALDHWDEPDPHVIGRRLVSTIPDEHLRDALAQCLPERVRVEIGRYRMYADDMPSPAKPAGRSRWARLAPNLRKRYCVAGEWKVLADFTAQDCDTIADEYRQRAAEQAAIEARFRALGERLRVTGTATVAGLDAADLGMAA